MRPHTVVCFIGSSFLKCEIEPMDTLLDRRSGPNGLVLVGSR